MTDDEPKIPTLRELHDAHVRAVFEAKRGNLTQTARALGISRRKMYRDSVRLNLRGGAAPKPQSDGAAA